MAKITRFTIKPFATDAPSGDVGQFGSLAAGDPNYTKDPAIIQALDAFLEGWASETIATNRPALEDFNGLDFLIFQALCYFQQAGIPEWDAGTTYYTNSFCQVAGVLYKSLVDTNINYAPASNPTKWELAIELVSSYLDTDGTLAANSDSKIATQKATKTYADTKVAKTGDETVAGVKTFSSFPVTPSSAPTTDYQAANKKYVNDNIPTSFIKGVYDTGEAGITWAANTNYTVTHNLNTTKVIVNMYFRPNSGVPWAINTGHRDNGQIGVTAYQINLNTILFSEENLAYYWQGGSYNGYSSGQYRVIVIALN